MADLQTSAEIPPPSVATVHYRSIFAKRTPEEMHTLAHIKRFMELLVGDVEFRADLKTHIDDLDVVAARYELDLDFNQMLPLFHSSYLKYRFSEEERQWPLARAWDDYMEDMLTCRGLLRESGATPANPRFDAWRRRQIARADGELGAAGASITHPTVAYELSQGCSVGCWFCGLSADRFQGYVPYTPDNAALWQGILHQMVGLFGTGAQYGFLYWATDPSDNPDYPRFLEDHYRITGNLPQTTTAAPLRHIELTREILDLFERHRCVTNRFSILTAKSLKAVHEAFTAEELMGVELVLQNREAMTAKSLSGRARRRLADADESGTVVAGPKAVAGTIACLTGLLVNVMSRTVQLVAPTRSSEHWPLGYRVYDTRHFADATDFRQVVDSLIATYMPEDLNGADGLAFRDDLTYHRHPDGFALRSIGGEVKIDGFAGAGLMGDMIAAGTHTVGEVHLALVRSGSDVFVISDILRRLFDGGLLDDDPANGRIRPRLPCSAGGDADLRTA